MRVRKAESNKRNQSGLKSTIQRAKPSQSRNKKLIQTHSSHIKILPYSGKQLEHDKQNVDIAQTAFKLLSAAGSNKQKQILLNLASQMQKQNKLKILLAKKQFTSDLSQLQSMLNHLKQQQIKQLSSLKIQIGKRKLHSLDQHDLRQDILNLNCYVMRRSKKDTMMLKDQGIDLIAEIYNKFDQQQRIIFDFNNKDKNSRKIKQNKPNIYINQSPNYSPIITQIQNYPLLQNISESLIVTEEKKLSNQNRELMQKILKLQKQNLRLNKQIQKIQQQFEYVVEEKLLLQQKYERCSYNQKSIKIKFIKYVQEVKQNLGQLKQFYLNNSQLISGLASQFTFEFQKIEQQIRQYISYNQYSCNSRVLCENSGSVNQNQFERNSNEVIASLQSQNAVQNTMIDHYVQIITEKQIQINQYLKTITLQNQRINTMKLQFQQFKYKYVHKNQKLNEEINKLLQQLLKIKTQSLKDINQIRNYIKQQIQKFIFIYTTKYQQNIIQYQTKIDLLTTEKQDCYLQIYQKQKQLLKNEQKLKQMQQELNNNINILHLQKTQSEQEKQKLIQNINLIQNILRSQKQKTNQINSQMNNLAKTLSQIKQENTNAKDSLSMQFNNLHQQHSQQIDKLNYDMNLKKQEINKLSLNIISLQNEKIHSLQTYEQQNKKLGQLKHEKLLILSEFKQVQEKYEFLIKKNNQLIEKINKKQEIIFQITNQYEKFKDSTISQCSMILQLKNQEILKLRQNIERQIMKKQDLEGFVIELQSKRSQNIEKEFIQGTKKSILQIKQNLLLIRKFQNQIKDDLKKVVQVFQDLSTQLTHKICQQQRIKHNFLQLQKYKTKKPLAIKIFENIHNFSFIPQRNYEDFLILYQKLRFNAGISSSINLQHEYLSSKDFYDKISTIGEFLVCQKGKQISQKAQQNNTQQKQILDVQQSKVSIKYQNNLGNQQLNNIQAITPQIQQKNKKEEQNVSILSQFECDQLQNFVDCIQNIDAMSILDQSLILQEISALRVELAQSFKVNQKITEELKFYQQKDMDKIFDF